MRGAAARAQPQRPLMAEPGGQEEALAFDRHLFACMVTIVRGEGRPLTLGLGLAPDSLRALLARHLPDAPERTLPGLPDGSVPEAIEEEDLRRLLAEHGSRGSEEEFWLAAILARRSLGANHLWQDLGLTGRADLSRLMTRHFAPLAALNNRDMKWKKFFYRELCQREGIVVCKSPNCDSCTDVHICFGPED